MTFKKGCLLGIVAFVVLIAAILGLVFWLTSGAVNSGEAFLAQLGKGETEAAYESTAAQFKAQTSLEEFRQFVQGMGLDHYASAFWANRSVDNEQAKLEGSIKTSEGGTVPLTMTLVKEGGAWRVLHITGSAAGVTSSGSGKTSPSDEEASRMVRETMTDFKAALDAGDFTAFHSKVSNLWKAQSTPDMLRRSFQSMIDRRAGFGAVAVADPTFSDAPSIDKDGLLNLDGYFAAADHPNVNFELEYIYEHPTWKLFGIHVSLAPGGQGNTQ